MRSGYTRPEQRRHSVSRVELLAQHMKSQGREIMYRHVRLATNFRLCYRPFQLARHAKIAQFDLAAHVYKDVGRFDVCKEKSTHIHIKASNPA